VITSNQILNNLLSPELYQGLWLGSDQTHSYLCRFFHMLG